MRLCCACQPRMPNARWCLGKVLLPTKHIHTRGCKTPFHQWLLKRTVASPIFCSLTLCHPQFTTKHWSIVCHATMAPSTKWPFWFMLVHWVNCVWLFLYSNDYFSIDAALSLLWIFTVASQCTTSSYRQTSHNSPETDDADRDWQNCLLPPFRIPSCFWVPRFTQITRPKLGFKPFRTLYKYSLCQKDYAGFRSRGNGKSQHRWSPPTATHSILATSVSSSKHYFIWSDSGLFCKHVGQHSWLINRQRQSQPHKPLGGLRRGCKDTKDPSSASRDFSSWCLTPWSDQNTFLSAQMDVKGRLKH